jgi:hypothetical protein
MHRIYSLKISLIKKFRKQLHVIRFACKLYLQCLCTLKNIISEFNFAFSYAVKNSQYHLLHTPPRHHYTYYKVFLRFPCVSDAKFSAYSCDM